MNIERFNKLKENFKNRNIDVEYFDSLEDVKLYLLNTIPSDCKVGIGHSGTLQKMNITELLIQRGNIVYDKELGKDRNESKALKKKALLSDWYISGSNAVSADGRIINVDHSGNRVAAITFGPDKVIIVVGVNKVVDTVEEGINRAKNVASPLNAKRAGYNPPCVELNKCVDCSSKERVCNYLSIVEGQTDGNRMKLCIVNEECGF
ncbi:lactate utilization protein [Sedimentibacter sp.]|uniref:lactate utilization protein n=1 Tax=Sedimentibacter sp. TaxID=1960295 RepID=UPI0028AD6A96|nr:lactate utilization protein [Sedimentibacter sp.]